MTRGMLKRKGVMAKTNKSGELNQQLCCLSAALIYPVIGAIEEG